MMTTLKTRVTKKLSYIDRKTQSVTANVTFESISLEVDGYGSDDYDYEFIVTLHSTGEIRSTVNSLTDYSYSAIYGRESTTSSSHAASVAYLSVAESASTSYPSICYMRISGTVGYKRNIGMCRSYHDGSTVSENASCYTANTATELTSIQFYSPTTQTITYSIMCYAVPKLQYRSGSILLSDKTISASTADIIYGGTNDTEGVDDLDGDKYNYYIQSELDTNEASFFNLHLNEDTTTLRSYVRIYNGGGATPTVKNSTIAIDSFITENTDSLIYGSTGQDKMTKTCFRRPIAAYISHDTFWNPTTATQLTSIMLRPSASISGRVRLWAVPIGYNGYISDWSNRTEISISGDFSGGVSIEIPPWATHAKVNLFGYSASGSDVEIDFDTNTIIGSQVLRGSVTTATAVFATSRVIGKIQEVSDIECILSLKSGYNRPMISRSTYNKNTVDIVALWATDTATDYTTIDISASNTNSISGSLVVSFI